MINLITLITSLTHCIYRKFHSPTDLEYFPLLRLYHICDFRSLQPSGPKSSIKALTASLLKPNTVNTAPE